VGGAAGGGQEGVLEGAELKAEVLSSGGWCLLEPQIAAVDSVRFQVTAGERICVLMLLMGSSPFSLKECVWQCVSV